MAAPPRRYPASALGSAAGVFPAPAADGEKQIRGLRGAHSNPLGLFLLTHLLTHLHTGGGRGERDTWAQGLT